MRPPLLLCLMLAAPLWAAEVKIDPPPAVKPGRLLKVTAKASDPKAIRWVNTNPGLDLIESETGRWAIASSPEAGTYRIAAYSDAGGPPAYVDIVVEGPPKPVPPAPVPPGPDPKPPGPTPDPAPTPAGPLRVLIVYESADLATLPPGKLNVLYDAKVRSWLNTNTDGGSAYRIWDKDTDASAAGKPWQDAMARAKRPGSLAAPKVLAWHGETLAGEWPLPDSADAMLVLLEKAKSGKGKR